MGKMDEVILVVDRKDLFQNESLVFQGLITDEEHVKSVKGRFAHFYETKRGYAENDERKKQPIPYVILRRGSEIFVYKRLKAGGESRLHEQLSFGVGGHMNLLNDNCRWGTNFKENMYRELHEELHLSYCGPEIEPTIIGLINDDSNEVGRVHIGVVAILDLPEDAVVAVKETDKLEGYWLRSRDLQKPPLFDSLENWSQMTAHIL